MGCEKRVFRNNQIRFDTLPDNKSWYGSQKNRMPFRGAARYRLTHAAAELEQEVRVLQLLLETLKIAQGEAKSPPCAGRQPCGVLFTPGRKIGGF